MASPHAAGALALLASKGFQRNYAGVSSLYDTLKGEGNLDWTDESGDGVKEPLLDFSNATVFDPKTVPGPGGGGPPPNQAPTASFTYSCTNLSCSFDASASSDQRRFDRFLLLELR
jgi:subtilisin